MTVTPKDPSVQSKKNPPEAGGFFSRQNSEYAGEYYVPEWAVRGLKRGILYFEGPELYLKQGIVSRHIHYGDYIIRDHRGIIDSFGRETFEKWYEKIGE